MIGKPGSPANLPNQACFFTLDSIIQAQKPIKQHQQALKLHKSKKTRQRAIIAIFKGYYGYLKKRNRKIGQKRTTMDNLFKWITVRTTGKSSLTLCHQDEQYRQVTPIIAMFSRLLK